MKLPTAKPYTVPEQGAGFAVGDLIGLSPEQFAARTHQLEFVKSDGAISVARVAAAGVKFAKGEKIHIYHEKLPAHGARKGRK